MFSSEYTSCACNQTPTASHWGQNDLIAFASCNSVRIYDPKFGSGGKIIQTLCGHAKRVNSVRWIGGLVPEFEIVSGSTDGTAIVWTRKDGNYTSCVLKGHDGNINLVDGLYKDGQEKFAVVLTASVDCSIKIWLRKCLGDEFLLGQTLNLGYSICMALKCILLPHTEQFLLAVGTETSDIDLYSSDSTNNFIKGQTLRGHENWVKGLDFTIDAKGDLILASSSQDSFIRLWRISAISFDPKSQQEQKRDRLLQKTSLKVGKQEFLVSLESVLAGHESWVYSVSWSSKALLLLSASLDKSMIIWEFDQESGLWLEKIRVGEVGGNTLGFYGGMFGPDGNSILAHGYHGAFHIWNYIEGKKWEPAVTIGGHFNEVVDLSWEPAGEFLVTVSHDQTSRIHVPWRSNAESEITWHEIARPQVHGYDMSCLAMLSRYQFASGAEEKVIRIFAAPINFVENFRRICRIQSDTKGDNLISNPKGASVPSLGLSNKAIFEDDNTEQVIPKNPKEFYPEESHFTSVTLEAPPTEETLIQNTLWPEVQKLYGHGYEVYCLAATKDGQYLASACKATTLEHASILLWSTTDWKIVQKLTSHTLTVVQLSFSPDSKNLLSVSRDRRWTLFSKNPESGLFELIATTDKRSGIHSRIIWTCDWSHDSQFFATGSRDGKVVLWTRNFDKPPEGILGQCSSVGEVLEFKGESVTALAFAPEVIGNHYLIAIGFESGIVMIYKWNREESWLNYLTIDNRDAHHLCVKKLAFRPVLGRAGVNADEQMLQLASCGSDHTVKIYDIFLT